MAIGNKQIGWSQESNLLWEISRQLDRAIAVLCTGPCPTTTSTTTALCEYLYEGVLTVGTNTRNIGYSGAVIGGFGNITPLSSSLLSLTWNNESNNLILALQTEECYNSVDVYINGIKYTLNIISGNDYVLESIDNPFPSVEETCIIQICPGVLCS